MTHRWLQKVSTALLSIYGELPMDDFGINIERSSSRSSAVPWGHIERGQPTNVSLVINPDLGYEKLLSDWTLFHELSHLLLPYRGYGNVWFSEGLATYYQNIIQVRSGLFDETTMWNKIVAGFERGRKEQGWNQINLTEVSGDLRENRQYMRVYWSGVLYWLNVDVELRKQGKETLDNALKQLKDCCETQQMTAEDIAKTLDTITNQELFLPLFKQYARSYRVGDYKSLLADLGIKNNRWSDGISLDNNAPQANIRQKISRTSIH